MEPQTMKPTEASKAKVKTQEGTELPASFSLTSNLIRIL